jgi:hypothetical protein
MLFIGVFSDIAVVLGHEWALLTPESIVYLDNGLGE